MPTFNKRVYINQTRKEIKMEIGSKKYGLIEELLEVTNVTGMIKNELDD